MKRALCWVVILVSGCAFAQQPRDAEAMFILARQLVVLTAAVHGYVRYEQSDARLTDAEILANATKHDSSLLPEFGEYLVRVRQEDRNGSVLLCTRDGKQGLIEDVGCTAEPDRHLWQMAQRQPCEFTVNVREVCARK
jgi:anti-sigma regulatory factor (Ser/Thr protein kinase)